MGMPSVPMVWTPVQSAWNHKALSSPESGRGWRLPPPAAESQWTLLSRWNPGRCFRRCLALRPDQRHNFPRGEGHPWPRMTEWLRIMNNLMDKFAQTGIFY